MEKAYYVSFQDIHLEKIEYFRYEFLLCAVSSTWWKGGDAEGRAKVAPGLLC